MTSSATFELETSPSTGTPPFVPWWERSGGRQRTASAARAASATPADHDYIASVNPGGFRENCASCALAVDARAGGGPAWTADADNRSPRQIEWLETIIGCPVTAIQTPGVATPDLVLRLLQHLPAGHRAVVVFGFHDDEPGHIVNAVNDGENFWIYDGQIETYSNDPVTWVRTHATFGGGAAMIPTTDWTLWPQTNPVRQCIEATLASSPVPHTPAAVEDMAL